jgi:hypothetical protein
MLPTKVQPAHGMARCLPTDSMTVFVLPLLSLRTISLWTEPAPPSASTTHSSRCVCASDDFMSSRALLHDSFMMSIVCRCAFPRTDPTPRSCQTRTTSDCPPVSGRCVRQQHDTNQHNSKMTFLDVVMVMVRAGAVSAPPRLPDDPPQRRERPQEERRGRTSAPRSSSSRSAHPRPRYPMPPCPTPALC